MEHNATVIDRIAMGLSGALFLLGVVGFGIVEILAGPPYGAAPQTNDAGEVIATPLVDPNLRTGLVIAGLLVLTLYGLYRLATPYFEGEEQETPAVTHS
ncbi:hypothetical protein [Halomicrobium urmianum]|uniref:hypothetical protein n=1 Tax=Halomicrobium urmianum TaxID=1586233 RepID=UPI001CDA4676|nr:hypothetical protein [Halomicrobium urmianum]